MRLEAIFLPGGGVHDYVVVLVLVLGAGIAGNGLLNMTLLATKGGKEEARGRVVEHRPGKRPSIIEFVPNQGGGPVTFKDGTRRPIGTEVDVLYSTLDPRNATVNRLTAAATRKQGAVAFVIGLVVLGIGFLIR